MENFDNYDLNESDQSRYKQPFELSNNQISRFEQVFENLKGDPKFLRSNVGKIHVPHIVDFKANHSNLKVFKKELQKQSGLVVLLIDVSGSMNGYMDTKNGNRDKKINCVRDLVANLFSSVENIPRIELRVFTYSGDYSFNNQGDEQDRLEILEIDSLKNCNQIVCSGTTPTPNAIHYVTKKFKDYRKNKTLFVFTDGSPSSYVNSYTETLLQVKKSLINAESTHFNIFGLGFCVDNYLDKIMKNSFRENYINLWNLEDIEKYLFSELENFVRSIRE